MCYPFHLVSRCFPSKFDLGVKHRVPVGSWMGRNNKHWIRTYFWYSHFLMMFSWDLSKRAERFQTQYPYLYLYWYSFAAEFPFCRKRGNTCNKQTKQSCKNIKDDVIKAQGISKDSMAFWWRMSYIISTCLSDILIPAKKTIIKANNKQY